MSFFFADTSLKAHAPGPFLLTNYLVIPAT